MREFGRPFVTLGWPYRVIGGPRFTSAPKIRDALAYLRTINSSPDDLASSHHQRGPSAASAMPPCSAHDHAPQAPDSAVEPPALWSETDELKPKARRFVARLVSNSTAGAPSAR